MSDDISALSARVGLTVASYHWGLGGTNEPIQYQLDIAHAAIDVDTPADLELVEQILASR